LGAFGFFVDKPKKAVRGFAQEFEDEEDLGFGEGDDEPTSSPSSLVTPRQGETPYLRDRRTVRPSTKAQATNEVIKGKKKGLGRVPDPPYHPSLRPAGIRELQRREAAAAEQAQAARKAASTRPARGSSPVIATSSDDVSSSLHSDDIGPAMEEDTRGWWDGIEGRKSGDVLDIPDFTD
jgi:hypothetical protein